jgi:hypothetical protein
MDNPDEYREPSNLVSKSHFQAHHKFYENFPVSSSYIHLEGDICQELKGSVAYIAVRFGREL